jgi:outer membrane protein OmpA-like peptidoglycan-associated protein
MHVVKRIILGIFCLSLMTTGAAFAGELDAEGAADHPLLSRMPGYRISRYEVKEFDSHPFRTPNGKEFPVEGRVYEIRYALQEGAKEPSRLQVIRNYEKAIKKIGGTVLKTDDEGNSYLKVVKDGNEVYAHVSAYITSEWMLYIVEKQAMTQDIVANAAAIAGDLKATGRSAIYGIYFDTGKAEIKPESGAALGEIAMLLKGDAGLKLYVVGHTDNAGVFDANMKLSQARALAVVQALAGRHGIATSRLKAYGVSSLAPIAPNVTEEGRAKNRRVELVKQ